MQPLTCPGSSAQAAGAHAPGLKEGNTPSDETAVRDRFEQDNESGKNGMADSTASSSSSDCGTSEDTDDDDGDERPLCLHQIPNTHILLIFLPAGEDDAAKEAAEAIFSPTLLPSFNLPTPASLSPGDRDRGEFSSSRSSRTPLLLIRLTSLCIHR